MQFKAVFVSIPLLFLTTQPFAENTELNTPNEKSIQRTPSTDMPFEIAPLAAPLQKNVPRQKEQLSQNQITNQIYKNRMYRITKYWKRPATDLVEKANVRVYLDEHGNVKDILLIDGQFSDAFAASIKAAIYKAAPFEMPKEQALKKQFQEIRINFSTE
ncbi:MAG: hypothetical protein GAK29_02347 [Acinetobacter bereziniae]|uniref:TonB C-terminal domain-containing protein n=1 Tax=Acinetobacter bereziniae TaxID=106648 RepID=A0A833PGA0_ACIBZ|nr:MAG: hypothetical protein GAK29_02347 [Acinetobacter bereziniae]